MAVSFTDYNALQPYFNQYRALASQYGFPADQGDVNLAADPNFQRWVLYGTLPYVAPAPAPPAPAPAVTVKDVSVDASSLTQVTPSPDIPPDAGQFTIHGIQVAAPGGGAVSGAAGTGQTRTQVLTPEVLGRPGSDDWWKILAIAAIAVLLFRKG